MRFYGLSTGKLLLPIFSATKPAIVSVVGTLWRFSPLCQGQFCVQGKEEFGTMQGFWVRLECGHKPFSALPKDAITVRKYAKSTREIVLSMREYAI